MTPTGKRRPGAEEIRDVNERERRMVQDALAHVRQWCQMCGVEKYWRNENEQCMGSSPTYRQLWPTHTWGSSHPESLAAGKWEAERVATAERLAREERE